MKKLFRIQFLLLGLIVVAAVSCKDDDDHHDDDPTGFDYHAHIMSPNAQDKHVGDTIHIHVEFEDHNGGTVHHVSVEIRNADTDSVIYSQPSDAHVHASTGEYEWHDDFVLSNANGVEEHTDWILEAKVWSHNKGDDEVSSQIAFHVHP